MENSSACLLISRDSDVGLEIALTERLTRKKAAGNWPKAAIQCLETKFSGAPIDIGENRELLAPEKMENFMNERFSFFEFLERENLKNYSHHFNPKIKFVTHHLCHASAAKFMSPFSKAIIVVMDGAGTTRGDFPTDHPELKIENSPNSQNSHEECSVYLLDQGSLKCVFKRWQLLAPSRLPNSQGASEGAGMLFEKGAKYIFNSARSAGKVMGLAAFGKSIPIESKIQFLENLNWSKAYQGNSKEDWESSGRFELFANVAASIQTHFEEQLLALLSQLKERFPEYDSLILTGGCALNCTANMKALRSGLFKQVYIPPFPSDECISLGAASALYFAEKSEQWSPLPMEKQRGNFGPTSSVPTDSKILHTFEGYEVIRPDSIAEFTSHILTEGKIVGWFQGRSESGPRALGNRSILANPTIPGVKVYLNAKIKFRESFRPFGCSVPQEKVKHYFDVPEGFESPFMSFSVLPHSQFRDSFREISHIDGTSRIQTVRKSQNEVFYELLTAFGQNAGVSCVLNTSLNVMGEPIVETLADAKVFLERTPVYGIAIQDFFVVNKSR